MRCYNCTKPHKYNEEQKRCTEFDLCKKEDEERQKYFKTIDSDIVVGSLLQFKGYKRSFKVIARDTRFIIAIKSWREQYHYTICDLQECIRGADNRYGCIDYKNATPQELLEVLQRLHEDFTEDNLMISYRNWLPLDIIRVVKPSSK